MTTLKSPPDRLYGRSRGKKLRPRQEWLLEEFLPRTVWPTTPFTIQPRELWLEVGFGGGEHAYELATKNPDVGYIAAEVFDNGICSLLSRIAPDGAGDPQPLPNLRLYTEDARPLLRGFEEGALAKLFLMFPDPWPKARHAKRRFVHPEIVAEVARVIRPGGEWRIASDDPTYQEWTDEVLGAQDVFMVSRTDIHPEGWPHTRYKAKAIAAGRAPLYWSLTRR
ncbi:tRNA (guanine(46)-N(7))-methyltransferase TrmB [Acidocella aminolytica]|uniref:tRNA (guanine-N(7)-)-methyltransferase n=1 Tax=Acidocella aminolytica 101 = DSM 11237 TaxID=1120923 RepID=A0A0D6PG15_9PROT|nr:tRNA (guanine(46)-N(7))-methyltransferase TrmB [Acidocella aminolytica]GAN80695.1 tRNA (guanine-N(7)-)-methyltransferase [Acidocella aminolytica 101 = DSM 11237]GBQ37512.1 tRNA (guanine-N7)-methyltransferase [Acidocella aminolytica 101 = DSM 11237]SHE53799.1 tRNA (guanine-N7-)-methyltransferase [Acidocella aminolytica 101 = DSM 11237]